MALDRGAGRGLSFASSLLTSGALHARAVNALVRLVGKLHPTADSDSPLAGVATSSQYRTRRLPDLLVRSVQMALTFLQVSDVGGVDGWFGHKTQAALLQFQADAQLDPTGRPDDATVADLARRVGWQ